MEKIKQKQLEQLRLEKQQKQIQYKSILKTILASEQTLRIELDYCLQFLQKNTLDNLSEYSPTNISRLVFDKQLEDIKKQFQKMPNQQVKIEHFLIIMLKVMKFPFEKCPYYLVGLKDMFYQIAEEGADSINYSVFFKYILGELVTMKEQEQNTQFQVQYSERKKQDYLLHDNGIKKIYYSTDVKVVLSLDERANMIKIYDQDMKSIAKFSPKKQKHNNKYPTILGFDYSQITMRLGIILSDQTISTVHLPNFLTKTQSQFENFSLNEQVFPLPQKMAKIYFIQMMNKWLTISQENNKVYIFDMERIRTQPQKVMSKIKVDTNQMDISMVLEIVQLSAICIVAGNQISFYNQNLTETKFPKFSHCQVIVNFKYCDQNNQFYLCGKEKIITIFTISRNNRSFKIWNFQINKIINDFEVFPFFDTIIIADQNNQVRLIHEPTKNVYQQQSYSHIVKSKDKFIKIYKLSKTEFIIYQTYMLVMSQQKIAIQKDIQYSFLPDVYYDQKKQELFLSVNGQIISFSLIHGEIRKNYSIESSNLQKHSCFFLGSKTHIFILDHNKNIFEIYQKDQIIEGENKNYRKKINIDVAVQSFYDEEMKTFIVISQNSINQIRNDGNNNFNTINSITFENIPKICQASFCKKTKYITFMTADQIIYQLKNFQYHLAISYRFIFPKDSKDHEDRIIIQFQFDAEKQIIILLTNKNQIYLIDKNKIQNQVYFNIQDFVPYKLKSLRFSNFKYQKMEGKKRAIEYYLILTDESGFIVEVKLSKIYEEKFNCESKNCQQIKQMFKDNQKINVDLNSVIKVNLNQSYTAKLDNKQICYFKAHQKQIVIMMKIKIEIMCTISISVDGYVRLWNEKHICLFSIKIPSLIKISWNMKEIQQIKNKKSIMQLLDIFGQHFTFFEDKASPIQVYQKSKKLKNKPQLKKVNLNEPIPIDIENKDIEEIVMQKQDYFTTYYSSKQKKKSNIFSLTQRINSHPWRQKKQFIKLYQKVSPNSKYNKQKVPQQIIDLRGSLDMIEKIKQVPNYKTAELILPQLSLYEPEKNLTDKKKENQNQNEQEIEAFESCLYVKSERKKKKINEFDEIDKEFKKKEMALTSRRWVPKKSNLRKNSIAEIKSQILNNSNEIKYDPIKAIQNIFEQHNKQCLDTKKGRLIRIPKIDLKRQQLFY